MYLLIKLSFVHRKQKKGLFVIAYIGSYNKIEIEQKKNVN
jgi:hypothetical protein